MAESKTPDAGEDDNSTEKEGDDSHLHEDQKTSTASGAGESDDASKTQDLAKAGREDLDPNAGSD